ncbi:MAG: hypothetical protein ISN29_07850, partial [Gammaproteobacteria bacterium AqS3]|nr:hypothetical protein [Gammaproteobacteria bacterium AqS3]
MSPISLPPQEPTISNFLYFNSDSMVLDEGSSGSFKFKLSTSSYSRAPDIVSLSSENEGSLIFDFDSSTPGNQKSVTITESNWNAWHTVTVTAPQDANRTNEVTDVRITHWVITSWYPYPNGSQYISSKKIAITAIDDDVSPVGVKLSRTSITMDEGSNETFTVRLKSRPENMRIVNLASNNSDVTVNKTSLTFTPSNWSQTQTVTVRAAHDDDSVDDKAKINLTGNRITSASVGVTVTDDEVGLGLETSSLTIVESHSKTFRVRLAKNPGRTRKVTLKSTNSEVTVNKTSLTFTTSNWAAYQTVRVNTAFDSDKVDDSATITLKGTGVGTGTVRVKVLDVHIRPTLSPSSLTIPEGGSRTFTVRPNTDTYPGNDRTFNVTSTNSDVTVDTNTSKTGNQTSLTFTADNWSTARTVTVSAAHDDNKTNDSAWVDFFISSVLLGWVRVNVTDDDVSLSLTDSSLKIVEGRSRTFRVKLAENPGSTQTVTLKSSNANVAVDTDLVADGLQNTLTFNSSKKWNLDQTVRVYTIHDTDTYKADDEATITLEGTGVVTDTVSVKVLDDDIRLTLSPSSLTIPEGGSETFTVRPDTGTYPGNSRTIYLTRSSGSSDVTASPTPLTFTSSNWTRPQTVTVSAATDTDKVDDSAMIRLRGDGVRTKYLNVKVLDDEIGLVLSPTSLTVNEGGVHETFKVKLDARPAYDRTISLSLSSSLSSVTVDTDTGETGNQTTMTLTPSNWDSENNVVTVKAAHDSNKVDETGTITLSGTGITSGTVDVTLNDDDKIGLRLSKTSLTIEEGGFRTFTVRPAAQLGTTRTVRLSSTNSKVTIDTNLSATGNQTALTFNASNSSTAKTVKISAAVDNSDKTDDTATIKLTGVGFVANSVDVEVIDDDIGLTLVPTSLTVNEGGTATFTVKLADRPANARTVHLSSNNDVTVDTDPNTSGNQAELTFAPNKWNNARTVTVRAGQDEDGVNDSETISLRVKRGGMTLATVSLPVTVIDNDRRLTVSSTALTVAENGSGRFTVKLAANPGGNVTVRLAQPTGNSANADVTFDTNLVTDGKQNTPLTFNASNWNTAKTVRVFAANDGDRNDESATINLTGVGVTTKSVSVKVLDDDIRLTLSATSLKMDEEGTKTFTVRLLDQPGNDRTVNLASNNTDVTFSPAQLTFKAAGNIKKWSKTQTVTVRAAEDSDGLDDTAVITLSGDGITSASVSVDVNDIDRELVLSRTSVTLHEGMIGYFYVKLSHRPSENVTVTLVQPSNTDVIASYTDSIGNLNGTTERTFTTSNWNSSQLVAVDAGIDSDNNNDSASILVKAGEKYDTKTVTVTVTEDDDAFIVSTDTLTVVEGESATFTVRPGSGLSKYLEEGHPYSDRPSGWINVGETLYDNPSVTIDADPIAPGNQDSVYFDPSNWNAPKTVTLSVADDDNRTDESGHFYINAAGAAFNRVSVKIIDDDIGMTLSRTSLEVEEEGASETFTVKLTHALIHDREITLTSNNSDVTFSPAKLTFTASNWNKAQTVTVSAANDSDKTDDTATINLSGTGGMSASLSVKVLDDDIGITLSLTSLTMDENDTETFTVRLANEPGNDRTVNLASDNTDVTFSPAQLNFKAVGNDKKWSKPQTVTLRAANDTDKTDDKATINLTGDGVTSASLQVTIIDDDVGLTLSDSSLTIPEGGSKTFTVKLDALSWPGNERTINLTSSNSDVTVDTDSGTTNNQTELTFTVSNWNTGQTVTVSAASDDGKDDESATINLTGENITDASVNVNVTDDEDSAVGLTASPTSLALVEEGASGTFTLKLASKPANNRSIALSVTGDLTVSPATLSFTGGDSGNWNTGQTVTVSATGDTDKIDDTASVNWAGDPAIENLAGISRITAGSLPVSITDNDDSAVVLTLSPAPPASLTVVEGASNTFTVKLAARPANGRTVTLASDNTDVTLDKTELTFTTADWSTAQTVRVTAADDDDGANDTANISLTGGRITTASLEVKVTDNDRGLSVSTTALTVPENDSRTFTVKLAAQPDSNVTVTLRQPTDNTDVTVDTSASTGNQNTLTFTTDNWNTEQNVTVKAADDADAIEDRATINVSATGDGYTDETATVTVTVTENDTAGLAIIQATDPLAVIEGSSATFTVALATQPSDTVTVTLAQPTDNINTDVTLGTGTNTTGNQITLTFTTSNWNTAQTVTVKAAEDNDDGSDDRATISISATGGDYGSVTGSVSVRVTDNDRGLIVSTTVLTVSENDSATFKVKLAAQPKSSVTVTLAQPADSTIANEDVTFDTDTSTDGNQSTLTFTKDNWNTTQDVTVRAAEDADGIDDSATINVSATGDGYGVANKVDVSVEVTDNDRGLTVSATSLTMTEGASGSFKVKLAAAPSADVTVNITQPNNPNSDVTTTPTPLTFTTGNWGTEQTVTVNAADDADGINDSATLQLKATGGGYTSETANVTVNVTDTD